MVKTFNPDPLPTENTALSSFINHFRLIWKSDGVGLDGARVDLKTKFTIVNDCESIDIFISFFKCDYKLLKRTSINHFFVYNLETCHADRNTP